MLQGYALMSHLAEQGWVCLSIDYRVAPHHRWPRHITDVKTAIAWARANVDKFGGDRNFVAVAGCSAGGHLSALAGLTANDPEMQAELPEGSDTLGRRGRRHLRPLRLGGPLHPRARTGSSTSWSAWWSSAVSPATRRSSARRRRSPGCIADAPPFLVIHGSGDSVIPVEQARSFVERLRVGVAFGGRATSSCPVPATAST